MASHEEILTAIAQFHNEQLSVIKLTEPFSASNAISDQAKRTSDVSSDAYDNSSPAGLAADLEHYKALFSKLRFSYLEQVTKEKFLRAIVGDPAKIVEHQENVQFEAQLIKVKADLKVQKEEVAALVEELAARGRELSRRHSNIQTQRTLLSSLPSQISTLQSTITSLRSSASTSTSTNPLLTLPYPATQTLLSQKSSELSTVDARLEALESQNARKSKDLQRLEGELRPLEVHRGVVVEGARETRRRKEESERGIGDEIEMKGRWYRGVEGGLRGVLDVRN